MKPTWQDPSDQQWYCRACWESYNTEPDEGEEAEAKSELAARTDTSCGGGDRNSWSATEQQQHQEKRRVLASGRVVGPSDGRKGSKNYWSWAGAWFSIPGANPYLPKTRNIRAATVNNRDAFLFAEVFSHYDQPPVALGMAFVRTLLWMVYEPTERFFSMGYEDTDLRNTWLKEELPSHVYDRDCFPSDERDGDVQYAQFLGRIGHQFPRHLPSEYALISFDRDLARRGSSRSIINGRLADHLIAAIEEQQTDYAVMMLKYWGYDLAIKNISILDAIVARLLRAAVKSCSVTLLHNLLQVLDMSCTGPAFRSLDAGRSLLSAAQNTLKSLDDGQLSCSAFLQEDHTELQQYLFSPRDLSFTVVNNGYFTMPLGILCYVIQNNLQWAWCCPPMLRYFVTNGYLSETVMKKLAVISPAQEVVSPKFTTPRNSGDDDEYPILRSFGLRWLTALFDGAAHSQDNGMGLPPFLDENFRLLLLIGPSDYKAENRAHSDPPMQRMIEACRSLPITKILPYTKMLLAYRIQRLGPAVFECLAQTLPIRAHLEVMKSLLGEPMDYGGGGLRRRTLLEATPNVLSYHHCHPSYLITWLRFGLKPSPGSLHVFLDLWLRTLKGTDETIDNTNPDYWPGGKTDTVRPAHSLRHNDSVEDHYFDMIRLLIGNHLVDLLKDPFSPVKSGSLLSSCRWGDKAEHIQSRTTSEASDDIHNTAATDDSLALEPVSREEFFKKLLGGTDAAAVVQSNIDVEMIKRVQSNLPDINKVNPGGKSHRFLKPVRPIRYLFSSNNKLHSLRMYLLFLKAGADPTLPGAQEPAFDRDCDACGASVFPTSSTTTGSSTWTQKDKIDRQEALDEILKSGGDPLAIMSHRDLDDGSLVTWLDPRVGQWCCSVCWKKKLKEIVSSV